MQSTFNEEFPFYPVKHTQDGFASTSLFPCLPFYLAHWRTIASDSTLEHRKRFVESTFRLMKTKGAREGGRKRGDGHLCAFAVYRRELWWLSRVRSSSETVERTSKGKRLEPSRIIRLDEQSIEVERGRHVRPDSDAVYPSALCRKTRPKYIKKRERERERGGREKRGS